MRPPGWNALGRFACGMTFQGHTPKPDGGKSERPSPARNRQQAGRERRTGTPGWDGDFENGKVA